MPASNFTRPTQQRLSESSYGGSPRVDKAAGVIRGVRILGRESKNGRTYSESAMQDAARLYEGRKVNVDHLRDGKQERSFTDGIGELRNVRRDGDAIVGDLHYAKSHPSAPLVEEYAERFPKQFGLSHHADGRVTRKGGKVIVESVEAVHSVDIVGTPATNNGLFESDVGLIPVGRKNRAAADRISAAVLRELDVGMSDAPSNDGETNDDCEDETMLTDDERELLAVYRSDLSPEDKLAKLKKLLGTADAPATDPAAVQESLGRSRLNFRGAVDDGMHVTPAQFAKATKPAIKSANLTESVERLPAGRINFRAAVRH